MNKTLEQRLNAIFSILDIKFASGKGLSSASQGRERELFVNTLLNDIFPLNFRFGSGEIVDQNGLQSTQMDIVLEKPIGYSFPSDALGPRLYLAENVAAVIEIKSDLPNKWSEVAAASEKLSKLNRVYMDRKFAEILVQLDKGNVDISAVPDINKARKAIESAMVKPENVGQSRIPYYAVGYLGWKKDDTLVDKLIPDQIDGIFLIGERKFATRNGRAPGSEISKGPQSILAFLHALELSFLEQPNRPPAFSEYR